jgi:hypothetical protein
MLVCTSITSAQTLSTDNHVLIPSDQKVSGDMLRNFLKNKPTIANVFGRTIVFKKRLIVEGEFTDSLAVYYFPQGHISTVALGTINFKDVAIHYTGNARGTTGNSADGGATADGYTANWSRVNFLYGSTNSGSSVPAACFFSRAEYTFNFNDVSLVSYCGDTRLHLISKDTVRNLKVELINPTDDETRIIIGLEQPTSTQYIDGLLLKNVAQIAGSHKNWASKVIIKNLDWDSDVWAFHNQNDRENQFEFINPIKPLSWNRYENKLNFVKEFYTHDLRVLDADRNIQEGVNVYLYSNVDNKYEYKQQTNNEGKIKTYTIYKRAGETNTIRDDWNLVATDYLHEFYSQTRAFENKVDEDILLFDDEAISEKNKSKVQSIDTIMDSGQLYDIAKLWKVDPANIEIPSLKEQLFRFEDGDLKLAKDWNLEITPNLAQTFEVDALNKKVKLRALKINSNTKFEKLVVTEGDIILDNENGSDIDFPYTDSKRDSYVRIKDVLDTDTIEIRELEGTNNLLGRYVGECGIAYKANPSKNLEIVMHLTSGDKIRTIYKKEGPGFDFVHRMGLDSTIVHEAMFMPTDRDRLTTLADSIEILLEKQVGVDSDDLSKEGILEIIKEITKETQKKE